MPKLLPLPFGRAVNVPLVPLTEAFQLFCRLWPPLGRMVTTHLLAPLTEKVVLNRSVRSWPRLTLTVQPPPPGLVGVGFGLDVPPSVMLELPLLWNPSVARIW